MKLHPTHHPIIYVRGFAMTDSAIENTVNTPYMGFNLGSTRVRQAPDGSYIPFIFESPLIRLMKEYGYRDIYVDGKVGQGKIPQQSIVIHRYYEDNFGGEIRPSIIEAARELNDLVLKVRGQICGDDVEANEDFKVYLVAHSMGGLICRCFLQNHAVGTPEARDCVDKVFTYGTPHNGIELRGVNVPRIFGIWDANNFNRKHIAEYLDLDPIDGRVNHLNGKFPPERFFSFIGTNHRDYNLTRYAVGGASDGLVKIENAYVAGAPRAHAHLSHSGHYGMVNSEEGYRNLVRFLYGDVLARGRLVAEKLPLPPALKKAKDDGKKIEGSYYFECTVTPRSHPPVPMSDRRVEMGSAVFRTYDEMFYPDRANVARARHPILYSVCLDTSKIESGRTIVYTVDLAVRSTDFLIDRAWFRDKRIPEENLFREKIVIKATKAAGGWNLRYTCADEEWGENRGKAFQSDEQGSYIPLSTPKGFEAKLYLTFDSWR